LPLCTLALRKFLQALPPCVLAAPTYGLAQTRRRFDVRRGDFDLPPYPRVGARCTRKKTPSQAARRLGRLSLPTRELASRGLSFEGGPGPTTRPFPLNPKAGRALNVFLASSERSVQSWTMSVGPRRFDENSAKVTVAGLGDRAPSRCASARVLARQRPAVAHQLRGSLETRDLAHFGDQSRGGQFRDSAQRLQPLRALRMSLRTAIAHLPAAVSVWL
jgi:hypothetical protein